MQITKALLIGLLCYGQSALAQTSDDTTKATENALSFADKFVKANFYQDWQTYTDLTCPSAIRYYGGKDGFKDHVTNLYFRDEPAVAEKPATVQVITLQNDNISQWQCVLQKVRETYIDNRKAKIFSYLIGQSLDNGATWKFVDVSHNDIRNIIYILPDVFGTLPVPEKHTTFDDEVIAENTAQKPVKKKTGKRKKE